MTDAPVKVLCITGWCRNGSTIIGNILNEIPGFFHVGELHFLWKNAAGKGVNNLCGCGLPLTECAIWAPILAELRPQGTDLPAYADEVIGRQLSCVRTRHTWRVLRQGLRGTAITTHAELMANTYRAIAERTGARVIVDTTKIPGEAALLPRIDGVMTYFVHLVRDPRAVALSWRYWKEYVYPLPARTSTGYWYGFNLASRAITRRYPEQSRLLRYEDFIADPAAAVDVLLRLCDEDPAANPMTGRVIDLNVNHTVTGNPGRFRTGSTEISAADDAWRAGLPASAKLTVLAMSWPLFGRYGYRYRGTFTIGAKAGDEEAGRWISESETR
ncbi:MAG TPA: sulfotransferase family protein [Streptosporangiaceae bacterium]|nr:sulfotransferase family protein [Streptosporangiaceae bacterium]